MESMFGSFDLKAGLTRLGLQFFPFLLAIVGHEFGHGWMAKKWGDTTAEEEGRLTLNPMAHLDPIGSVLLPAIGIISQFPFMLGWAKPVPIDPRRFRSYRPGLFWVALAGPLMNAVLALMMAILFCLVLRFDIVDPAYSKTVLTILQMGVIINYWIGVFNLLPILPLDGGRIIQSFLTGDSLARYENSAQYSFFIIIALLATGALKFLSIPVTTLSEATLNLAAILTGIPI